MLGKDFKRFAESVPDNAVVEYNEYGWQALRADKLRAQLIVAPVIIQEEESCKS